MRAQILRAAQGSTLLPNNSNSKVLSCEKLEQSRSLQKSPRALRDWVEANSYSPVKQDVNTLNETSLLGSLCLKDCSTRISSQCWLLKSSRRSWKKQAGVAIWCTPQKQFIFLDSPQTTQIKSRSNWEILSTVAFNPKECTFHPRFSEMRQQLKNLAYSTWLSSGMRCYTAIFTSTVSKMLRIQHVILPLI